MEKIDGIWYMKGKAINDSSRIKSWQEVVELVNKIGFLPFFANEVEGFSLEEMVAADFWWTGIASEDPWEWREIIARSKEVAYGKFFDKRAGFISKEWLPIFANARRDGYDFDSRYADGKASRREKMIMDFYMQEDDEGDIVWKEDEILSTELKKLAGFGKDGAKNYPGIITSLQMNLYLVISDFKRRKNKKTGNEYGMAVSIMQPPEVIWGYDLVTSAYGEDSTKSWEKIYNQVLKLNPKAEEKDIIKIIGKKPS